jgi:hypothetical protein
MCRQLPIGPRVDRLATGLSRRGLRFQYSSCYLEEPTLMRQKAERPRHHSALNDGLPSTSKALSYSNELWRDQ